MKHFLVFLLLPLLGILSYVSSDTMQDYDIVKPGNDCPITQVIAVDGKIVEFQGKIVWLNFFATWCPPCKKEFPEMRKVWEKHQANPNLIMISIGREEPQEAVVMFAKKMNLPFVMVADLDKAIYNKFAKGYIPRTYIIGLDGKIIAQEVGYEKGEFDTLAARLDKELEAIANQQPQPTIKEEKPATEPAQPATEPAQPKQ